MARGKSVAPSGNGDIDAVLDLSKWDSGNLTFSFPASSSEYSYAGAPGAEPGLDFQPFTVELRAATVKAFAVYSQYANLTFTETTGSGADIRLGMANIDSGGRGYSPGDGERNGDVFLPTSGSWTVVKPGTADFTSLLHEIGHAMGLAHQELPPDPSHIGWDYSVMSYQIFPGQEPTGNPPSFFVAGASHPQTLMLADVAALQYLYGANFSTRSSNTVYSWSERGELFIDGVGQGRPAKDTIYMTLWDGGGIDTYDFSNYTTTVHADLRPGEWSTPGIYAHDDGRDIRFYSDQQPVLGFEPSSGLDHPRHQIFGHGSIANALLFNNDPRSLIENANGGSGDDILIGNQANNTLHGNGGDDVLVYTAGNDSLFGDARGGNGDTADFSLAAAGVSINPVAAFSTLFLNGQLTLVAITPGTALADISGNRYSVISGGATVATLTGIENLTGSGFGDIISGDTGNNFIRAGDGNDRVYYTGGLDDIDGEAGNDTVDFSRFGSAVSVSLVALGFQAEAATSDAATIAAGGALRPIAELAGLENVTGTGFADILNGNSGANLLDGGAGADRMAGGAGNDTYVVDDAGDSVTETLGSGGNDTVQSSVTFALGTNLENLTLTGTANINGSGNELDNTLTGNSGRNTLTANGGNDDLTGGGGNDQLRGGSGNDSYRFSGNFGSDTIDDDSGAADRIVITGATVLNGTSRSGNDLIVELSTGTITITDHFTTGTVESLQFNGATVVLAKGLIGADLPGIITGTRQSETLDGRGGDDFLFADNGNDVLLGGDGNDRLDGGNGRDILDGGAGNDMLAGGRGGDTFVFRPGSGHDTITDFSIFEDRLDLQGFTGRPAISRAGSTLELDFGGGDTLDITLDSGADHWRLPSEFAALDRGWFDFR